MQSCKSGNEYFVASYNIKRCYKYVNKSIKIWTSAVLYILQVASLGSSLEEEDPMFLRHSVLHHTIIFITPMSQ